MSLENDKYCKVQRFEEDGNNGENGQWNKYI